MKTIDLETWHPDVGVVLQPAAAQVAPFPHQREAWDRMSRRFDGDPKQTGLLVIPTGGGKTFLAAHWLLRNRVQRGARVLWLAHRHSLLRQAQRTFLSHANVAFPKPELRVASVSSEGLSWSGVAREHDIVFSSTQTASREANLGFIELLKKRASGDLFVVLDEAHHAPAPEIARLLRKLKSWGCQLLGLTATPVRSDEEDQKRLSALFDQTIVYQTTRRSLTEQGILATPVFETVKTSIDFEREFTKSDLAHLERYGDLGPAVLRRLATHAGRNKLIVQRYKADPHRYGPTIVFAADTLHAQTLAQEFRNAGVDAESVDYSRKDAQAVIQRYQREKKPDVLVNVEMLTEGFDAPHTRTVFIARPTKSESLLAQMVGRALRGRKSGGNDRAYLVTFLDTWTQFDVLDTEYPLGPSEDTVSPVTPTAPQVLIRIPPELIAEAYRILQSNVRGELQGVFQCLPHGWYVWEESFEDDQQRRTVMVYAHQLDAFKAMLQEYAAPADVVEEVSEDLAQEVRRRFFRDMPDPLPRWLDIKALLDARRKGCELRYYSFEEKAAFDPCAIAAELVGRKAGLHEIPVRTQEIWTANAVCRLVYKEDMRSFQDDVFREVQNLLNPPSPPPALKMVERDVRQVRPWPDGHPGYSLIELRDAVVATKKHFPSGAPLVQDLAWSSKQLQRYFGFYRHSDRNVTINCVLNSPDVPRFVLEFLMYHELLHADMPHQAHSPEFRLRERKFTPSATAIAEAGETPPSTQDGWRILADQFLDSFRRYYRMGREPMDL